MDKRYLTFVGMILILLVLAGCSFNIRNMNLPFVSTSTVTLIPTSLPSATPTLPPKASKPDGVILLDVQTDGRTLLTDSELGVTASFSPQWLVIGLDEDIPAQLSRSFPGQIPEELMASSQAFASISGLRVAAMDYANSFGDVPEFNSNILIGFDVDPVYQEQTISLLLETSAQVMPTEIPKAKVTYQSIETNPSGIEYGKLIITHPRETFGYPVKQMVVFMKVRGGLLTVTGTSLEEAYTELEPYFQRVVDSISLQD